MDWKLQTESFFTEVSSGHLCFCPLFIKTISICKSINIVLQKIGFDTSARRYNHYWFLVNCVIKDVSIGFRPDFKEFYLVKEHAFKEALRWCGTITKRNDKIRLVKKN